MKKILFLQLLLLIALNSLSQEKLFVARKDSTGFDLTIQGASHLASLPLKCIAQEFPNKTNHTSNTDSDHVLLPRQLHPAFYGCFDWHSSVHGHWMLVRLLKLFPAMPEAPAIRAALSRSLTPENIKGELNYFSMPLTSSWERTYGWAWILKLDEELYGWDDPEAKKWLEAMQPLTRKIVELWMKFLPRQTYANRTGVHPNTAFGLVMALDYARKAKQTVFEKAIIESSKKLFAADKAAPVAWEPNGSDFLSPSLEEADLMRRILSPAAFIKWFSEFISVKQLQHLSVLPIVSDRTDLQIVHLDGLCFSRSWCMRGIASSLPRQDPRIKILQRASFNHLQAALPHVVSGSYGGEHWLASFAVYAF
ncbi:MAG: DUF2891 domain-containing protein [Bacteroidetes bacterium]|nr:DUF2891 domain-containing protein [Bacteroidota bacterium]